MVESLPDLDRVLTAFEAPRSWVVKSPLSASGRDRYIERMGPEISDPRARRTIARLFDRHGPLLFEPWMNRTADFGVSALLTLTELRIVGIHGQHVDRKGQFAGIDLQPSLSGSERERLLETVESVALALRRADYAGPFGIDAWRYRKPGGEEMLHPLGEINARLTFGRVAGPSPNACRVPSASASDARSPHRSRGRMKGSFPSWRRDRRRARQRGSSSGRRSVTIAVDNPKLSCYMPIHQSDDLKSPNF